MTNQNKTSHQMFIKTKTNSIVANPTKEQINKLKDLNISQQIRYLASCGYSTKQNMYSGIANYLKRRTQHVRNVLTQPLKK